MNSKESHLISVIIPTYNRADHIERSLDSVFEQTYRPIEVLIVDDGSTDDTKKVVEEWLESHREEDFSLYYYWQENAGAPVARNFGIEKATGHYLQFMDSDDDIMPEKFQLQIEKMEGEKTPICICGYYHVDENMNLIMEVGNDRTLKQILRSFYKLHTLIGVMERSLLIEKDIRWNPELKVFQDRDFYHKLFLLESRFSVVDQSLFKWIRHGGERIYDTVPHTHDKYAASLRSIMRFYFKRRKEIESFKRPHAFRHFRSLFVKTSVGEVIRKTANSLPKSLRFWKEEEESN